MSDTTDTQPGLGPRVPMMDPQGPVLPNTPKGQGGPSCQLEASGISPPLGGEVLEESSVNVLERKQRPGKPAQTRGRGLGGFSCCAQAAKAARLI